MSDPKFAQEVAAALVAGLLEYQTTEGAPEPRITAAIARGAIDHLAPRVAAAIEAAWEAASKEGEPGWDELRDSEFSRKAALRALRGGGAP